MPWVSVPVAVEGAQWSWGQFGDFSAGRMDLVANRWPLVTLGPPMWTGEGRAGACSSWFSSCTDGTFRWGETPDFCSRAGVLGFTWGPAAPRVRAPSSASPRLRCLKKIIIKKKCVPLQSHTLPPNPALQQRFWVAQDLQLLPGAESTGERRWSRGSPSRRGEPAGVGASFFLPNHPVSS